MRRAVAIALNHPDELYARNRGMLDMKDEQMHDFASTSEKGLPDQVTPKKLVGAKKKAVAKKRFRQSTPFMGID